MMSLKSSALKGYLAYLKPRLVTHHLSRPLFYTENTLYFHVSGEQNRFVISLDDTNPRFYLAEEDVNVASLESKFLDLLKKELGNAYLVDLVQVNEDRVIRFSLTVINGVYKEEARTLYLELIPHHANLILCDDADTIIGAYRSGEMSDERPMLRGLHYLAPIKKPFADIPEAFDPVSYVADCLDEEKQLAEHRKKDRFGWLFEALKKKAKLLERKIQALESDKQAAEAHLNDGDKGDAIYMKINELNNRMGSFTYEGFTVELDPSRSLSGNAQLYYRRAKKAKETLKLNEANQAQTAKDLADVKAALLQLSSCDEEGLEELAKELEISPQKSPQKKKSGDWRGLSHDSIPFEVDLNGTKILFGKSAKQNDCLTFLLDTAKDHLWFHIAGTTGSHVMIKKASPSDEEIRTACEIALLNSGEEDGDILYALRKNVRKGNVMGLAIVKDGKTIHLKSVRPETKALLSRAERMKL
jgi:predicted ribosome quality control (RQC) complex YloA/Tae2 family protein